jgi:S-adenosyl-L-methionine hydrolase (adenosine-forming)
MRRVVLLTDFGTADGYAAAMAGVIAAAAPGALVEHAAHDIAPGDILGAALALSRYAHLYPPGTVHLVVVDPGVGTARRPLAAEVDGRAYVGPDNGVFTLVLRGAARAEIVELAPTGVAVSPTFHGRDIFAPAAARLASGRPLADLGGGVSDPLLLDLPQPVREGAIIRGVVLHVDRFGTLLTNVPASWVRGGLPGGPTPHVEVDGVAIGPLRRTFADVAPGSLVALIGSLELLEVAVRDGAAARRLQAPPGSPVTVTVQP